jgi:hypothetical protein
MIIKILDELMAQALKESWVIKYVALSPVYMRDLVEEVSAFAGPDFKVDTLAQFKDIPLKVKDIVGFQVAYELAI